MQFEVFTLLPEVFPAYLESSILQRARQRGLIEVHVHNIRDYTRDKHHTTDDIPYGGGGGMVMKPEPVFDAVESVLGAQPECPIILLTPQGRVFNQRIAAEFSLYEKIALICGRYEGVDERIRTHLVTDEISLGDYVLTGGELPALDSDRCHFASHLRRARRSRWRDGRLSRFGSARISALHASARISQLDGAGRFALRRSRQDQSMAARTIVAPHARTPTRFAQQSSIERSG